CSRRRRTSSAWRCWSGCRERRPLARLELVLFLERNLLGGVHRAQVRVPGLERGADLLVGQRRAALGAGPLDHGVDAVGLEVHPARLYAARTSILVSVAVTWVTGLPVARSTRCGRSTLSHFERCLG